MHKILCLLPFPPRLDAAHGGSRVIAHLLVRIAEHQRLALLYFRSAEDPPLDDRLQRMCEIAREVNRPLPNRSFWGLMHLRARIITGWLRARPILVTTWATPAFAQAYRSLRREWRPHLIQAEFHMMAQYLAAHHTNETPHILIEHEPGAEAARDQRRIARGWQRILSILDHLAWQRFERRILQRVQAIVVFTERDRQAISRLKPSANILRIPLQTVPPPQPFNPIGESPPRLLFIGNFMHPPNVDAALRLIKQIFPPLRAAFPDLEIDIVGAHPPAALFETDTPGAHITGFVPDVTPYLDRAAVVVVPLRLGGGMRVKVLEALAAGKALVASPLATEGLELIDGKQVILAESDRQFTDQVAALIADPSKRRHLADSARHWACTNLHWDNSIAAYLNLYSSLHRSQTTQQHTSSAGEQP